MKPLRLLVASVTALLVSWFLVGRQTSDSFARSVGPGWNLVLISIDTLRADRTSLYGYHRQTTPTLEAIARDGVVFEDFYYSGGGTLPSHMSLFTSHHPAAHGVEPHRDRSLSPQIMTLPEVLAGSGFSTAAFVDPGWMNPSYGFGRGFDSYDDRGHRLRDTLPRAIEWIRDHASQRFFLFLHTYDVHSTGLGESLPYDCPGDSEWTFVEERPKDYDGCDSGLCGTKLLRELNATADRRGVRVTELAAAEHVALASDLYDGCVFYVDQQIGHLANELARLGLLERTLLVVLSDHGEEFGEHGRVLHDQGGFEELARVPWMMRVPGLGGRSVRVRGLAAMVDVAPTLLSLLGLPPLPLAQGQNLEPSLESGVTGRRDVHMYSVLRAGTVKVFPDEKLFFSLADDPREIVNLWEENSPLKHRMVARSRRLAEVDLARLEHIEAGIDTNTGIALSPEDLARLRALGYLR